MVSIAIAATGVVFEAIRETNAAIRGTVFIVTTALLPHGEIVFTITFPLPVFVKLNLIELVLPVKEPETKTALLGIVHVKPITPVTDEVAVYMHSLTPAAVLMQRLSALDNIGIGVGVRYLIPK